MASTNPSNVRRRIPAAQRQRAVTSCDRCKRRRSRCVRPTLASQSCQACLDSNAPCQTTIVRKQRVYGSIETLNAKYRILDALVKGLFPDKTLETVQDLSRFALEHAIAIPNIDNEDHTITNNAANEHSVSPTATINTELEVSSFWPCNIDQTIQGTVFNLPEETCIIAPHGVAHYVGPASTFDFANKVRRLVAKCSRSGDNDRSRLRAGFTDLQTSIALEPRIGAHPAATVREHETTSTTRAPPESVKSSPAYEKEADNDGQDNHGGNYKEWLRGILPARPITDSLVAAFFDRVHPNCLLFHRGSFQTRYDSIWRHTKSYTYNAEPGWLCCLFMVFVFGAQALENHQPDDSTNLQRRFLKYVRERFTQLALTASLANVQALLLLQLYEHSAGERNTAWILLGQATRMAIALGMHREGTLHNFDPIERNTRRMVWHTIYAFEQYASLQLGRPTTMKALEVNIGLPDESLLDGNNLPSGYLKHESQLLDLTRKVHHFATAASPNCFDVNVLTSLLESAASLNAEFDSWREQLPSHLTIECKFHASKHRRAVLLLHMLYHHLRSTITRPYLLCRTGLQIDNFLMQDPALATPITDEMASMSDQCIASAAAVARIMRLLLGEGLLETIIWTDVFYLYHALMLISVSFLSAQRLSRSSYSQMQQNLREDATMMINICRSHRLAPTYHILSSVAIQLAQIVGLVGEEGPSRDEIRDGMDVEQQGQATADHELWPKETPADAANFMFEPLSDLQYFGNTEDYLNWNFFDVQNIGQTPQYEYAPAVLPNPFSDLFPTYGQRSQSRNRHG